jgi:hypothetical protein
VPEQLPTLYVSDGTPAFTHPRAHAGTLTRCVTAHPAPVCTCGMYALVWLKPGEEPPDDRPDRQYV